MSKRNVRALQAIALCAIIGVSYIQISRLISYFSVVHYWISVSASWWGKSCVQSFKALDAARPSAPYVTDFVRLFPEAIVTNRFFSRAGQPPGFNVEVDLYERYELLMQLPVLFDPTEDNVIGYGEPRFHILEISSQKGRDTSFNRAGDRRFGSAEWQKIVEKGGDFNAIGYTMITDQPVPGVRGRSKVLK